MFRKSVKHYKYTAYVISLNCVGCYHKYVSIKQNILLWNLELIVINCGQYPLKRARNPPKYHGLKEYRNNQKNKNCSLRKLPSNQPRTITNR